MTTIEQLDEILSAVSLRSTVYAHEILVPLRQAITGTDIGSDLRYHYTMGVLESKVSECNGQSYLHAREFIDALLDLRNALRKEEPSERPDVH